MQLMRCFRIGAVLLLSSLAVHAAIPADQPLPTPTYGINLGNTLEPPNGEGSWGPAATQAVINSMAASGFNCIRIPCAWDSNADPSTYQIDLVFMARVKQVVDWAIAAGLYVVVNDHWDGGWMENNLTTNVDSVINAKMQSYWTQIATEFAGYDNHLVFAAANEPSVASPEVMNTLQVYYQTFVDAVRGTGGNNTNRWLVLQSVSEPSWMDTLPADPTPSRMMVEYHQYTPSLFTIIHTDQTWGNAMYYWGAAYHYSGDPSRNATWGEEDEIDAFYQQLHDQYVSKGIPVMIGEFGAWTSSLSGTAATWNRNSTLYWDKYAAESARAHGIHPFFWTIQSDVFDWTTGAVLDPDAVNVLTGGDAPPPPNGAPYAVSGLTATTAGTGQIDLSWNAASGAASYNLYRAVGSGDECNIAPFATGVTGTSYSDSGLNDGTTYYYQVVAVNGSGQSGFTAEAHATTPGTNPDPAQYNFETDPQGWAASGNEIAGVATSTTKHYAGNQSLAVNFNGTAGGTSTVSLDSAVVPVGATVTFHVWIPAGHAISTVEPWMQDKDWNWTQTWYGSFTANAWNTFTLTVPSTATTPFNAFGLRFTTSAGWTGTCYIDSISWSIPAPVAPTGLTATQSGSAVSLSWGWASDVDSYTVKRSTTSGSGYATIATGVASPSYTDNSVVSGTTYYYVVSAANASGSSPDSGEASATSGVADDLANADIAVSGTVSGSYAATQASDNTYETLTEVDGGSGKPSNHYSLLEHKWTFNVTGGDSVVFSVEAYKPANSDGDDFVFAYSTDNVNYTDMLTVTKTADDNIAQSYTLPASVSGTVYIRVRDTDRTAGNRSYDSVYIDEMFIHSVSAPPVAAPASNPSPSDGATGIALSTDLGWTVGSNADSHWVFFGYDSNTVATATTNSTEFMGAQSGSVYAVGPLASSGRFYWRIDEVTAGGSATVGPVWSFATTNVPAEFNADTVGTIVSGDTFDLGIQSSQGQTYRIESTENLLDNPVVWTVLSNNVPGTGGVIHIQDAGLPAQRYYRVILLNP